MERFITPGRPCSLAAEDDVITRPGDPPACRNTKALYLCTLPPGHDGDHVAHGDNEQIVATWPR